MRCDSTSKTTWPVKMNIKGMLIDTVRVIPMESLTRAGGLTELRDKGKLASSGIFCRIGATDLAMEKKVVLRLVSPLGPMMCLMDRKHVHPNCRVIWGSVPGLGK